MDKYTDPLPSAPSRHPQPHRPTHPPIHTHTHTKKPKKVWHFSIKNREGKEKNIYIRVHLESSLDVITSCCTEVHGEGGVGLWKVPRLGAGYRLRSNHKNLFDKCND